MHDQDPDRHFGFAGNGAGNMSCGARPRFGIGSGGKNLSSESEPLRTRNTSYGVQVHEVFLPILFAAW